MENQPQRSPATPEEIWKILREVSKEQKELSRQMKESKQETAQQLKETDRRMQEIERVIQEASQEIAERQKETDRLLNMTDEDFYGPFDSPWSLLVDRLAGGDLAPLLKERNIAVEQTSTRARGTRNGNFYEFDILAENREQVVVVEVRDTLPPEDVTYFLEKLAYYTTWAPEHKGKQILGAVAYLKADSTVTTYAERQGLYVIRATGSSATITNREDFEPRVFH